MKTHKACDKSNNIFSLNDRLNIFNNLRASTPVCLATVLHYVHYSAAILVRYRSLQRIRTLGRSKICINVVLPVLRAYAPSSTPGFSGNTRVGYVVMSRACTSFYASISTTSCLANQIGLISGLVHFALCTRPTRRVLRDGCLANQNVWMEDTCSCISSCENCNAARCA